MPFVQARPGQEATVARLVERQPLLNLFLIANLAQGLGPDLDAWVDQSGGVLMRLRSNWMLDPGPYPERFDFAGAAALVDDFPSHLVGGATGLPVAIDPLCAALRRYRHKVHHQALAALTSPPAPVANTGTARPATAKDLDALAHMYADAGDLSRPREAVERMLPTCWVIEQGGALVSAAYVIVQSDRAGMVGGVFTPAAYRQRGYASTLVHALSRHLIAAGKTPCLFYHNPDAGRIYVRLGYREISPWRMASFL